MTHSLTSSLPFYLKEPTSAWYDRVPWFCLDLETTNLEKGDPCVEGNRVVLTAFSGPGYEASPVVVEGTPVEWFRDQPVVLVAHHSKFELGWLMREGVDVSNMLVWDTLLAEYCIAGNKRVDLSLGATAARYGLPGKEPVVDKLIKAGVCPSEIPRHWLKARVAYDVETTMKIARLQYEILKRDGLMNVFFTRCIVTPVLAAIEREGMTLDPARVDEEYRRCIDEQTKLVSELDTLTGGINLRSGKQLGDFLYGTLNFEEPKDRRGDPIRTKSGSRSTSKATIEKLGAKTPEQKEFVELQAAYAKVNARLTKSLEFFSGVCREHGARFRGRFNQAVTQTHRLSSSGRRIVFRDGKARGVQFQNLPREYKRLFTSSDMARRSLVETDGAQLEFRVAGQLGNDPRVLADVESGADIHRFTASVLLQKPENQVTDKQRTAAKAHCFPLDTEILTPSGWRTYDTLKVGDAVINYDAETGLLVQDVVIDYAAPHVQEVIEMRTEHNWSVRSTPGHRWYGDKRISVDGTRAYVQAVTTTEELNSEHRIYVAAPYVGGAAAVRKETAERLAWLWTDGTERFSPITGITSQGSDGRRRGAFGSVIQKKHTDEVTRLFGARTHVDSGGCSRWTVPAQQMRDMYAEAGLDPMAPDYEGFVRALTDEVRDAWVRAVCLAEGNHRKGAVWRVAQNPGPLAQAIKLAGFLSGYDVRVTRITMKYNGNPHELITLRTRPYVTGQRVTKHSCGEQMVWCVSTKNQTVVMRQGETMSISGNTFKPLYGGNSGTPAEVRYYAAFREKYKALAAEQKKWTYTVLAEKSLRIASGLRFYWADTKMKESGYGNDKKQYITNTPSIYNFPIQSFATADIIPISLAYTYWGSRGIDAVLINTIHDSVVADVADQDVEAYKEICKDAWLTKTYAYLEKVYGVKMTVPLAIGMKIARHWGDTKTEEKFQ